MEYNTITVLPSGVATISGPNQSALVQALGTLTDLGDAQVVVWSAGFAAVSRAGFALLSQSFFAWGTLTKLETTSYPLHHLL